MAITNRDHVEALLRQAATAHAELIAQLPADLQSSLPVDAQGLAQAIDHLATAAGLSAADRHELVRPHAVNPAVMHAQVFGPAPLTRDTVIGSFVDGARVRAESLATLADAIGGGPLGQEIRTLLVEHPPPAGTAGDDVVAALRATYAAQERAAVLIAIRLDDTEFRLALSPPRV